MSCYMWNLLFNHSTPSYNSWVSLCLFLMDRVVDILERDHKVPCLSKKKLHKTILSDHQTNDDNNI
jgi:hypothetical protein